MSGPANAELESLRAEIAAARGLSPHAVGFLDGTTLAEIEAQADELARVIGASGARHEPGAAAGADLFTIAAREKARRKASLAALFSGRTPQPRDESGRFTGFDGGARQPLPVRSDPEREHGELVAQLVSLRRISGGGPSF
jgi:hypothetical protein